MRQRFMFHASSGICPDTVELKPELVQGRNVLITGTAVKIFPSFVFDRPENLQ